MKATTLFALVSSVAWLGACASSEDAKSAAPTEAAVVATQCDKVTTYVCPGDPCLCKMVNCAMPNHNGDFVPCNGPPVPGCQFDFFTQYCFPIGQPIPCDAAHVPVNMCGLPCSSALNVTYTPEANGCCRGVRQCFDSPQPQPIEPIAIPLGTDSNCSVR